MIKKLFAIVAIFSLSTSSFATETITFKKPENVQKYDISDEDNIVGGNIELQGDITDKSADMVHEAMTVFKQKGVKSIIIHLNSLGGDVPAGARIVIDMLEAKNDGARVGAYVDHKEVCASMCTGIFAAAGWRAAAPDTLWVFHSPYCDLTPEQKADPETMKEVKEVRKMAREALMSMYKMADPVWAKKELKKYIYNNDGKELVLTGGQILDHSIWFIDYYIED